MWIKENLNPLQRMTGDCSVRAVAKALDITWEKAHLMLSVNSYLMGDIMNSNTVIGSVLREHGFKRANIPDSCPDCYTVAEFAENNPQGVFVVGTGNHVVAVIDGKYYDTWDSGDENFIYVWYQDVEPIF